MNDITEMNKICREISDEYESEQNEHEAVEMLRDLDIERFVCPFDYCSDNWFWEV